LRKKSFANKSRKKILASELQAREMGENNRNRQKSEQLTCIDSPIAFIDRPETLLFVATYLYGFPSLK